MSKLTHSIKTRVALIATIVIVGTIALLSTLHLRELRDDLRDMTGKSQLTLVSRIAEDLDKKIDLRVKALDAAAKNFTLRPDARSEDIEQELRRQHALQLVFDSVAFVSAAGKIVVDLPANARTGLDISDRDHFKSALESRKPVVSAPFHGRPAGHPLVVIAAPMFSANGELAGMLTGAIYLMNTNFLSNLSNTRYDSEGGLALFGLDRTVIASRFKDRILQKGAPPGQSALFDRMMAAESGWEEAVNSRGRHAIFAYTPLKTAPWVLRSELPAAEAFAPIESATRRIAIRSLLLACLLIPLLWFASHRLLGRLTELKRAMRAMRDNPKELVCVPVIGDDEIAQLGSEFNALARERRTAREGLARLASIVESSNDAIVSRGLDGIVWHWNPAAERIYGFTAKETIGQPISIILPADRFDEPTVFSDHLARGERISDFETVRLTKDGRLIETSLTLSPLYDGNGEVIGASIISREIGKRKALERKLTEQRELLETYFQQSSMGMAIVGLGSKVRKANHAFCTILGYSEAELQTIRLSALTHPEEVVTSLHAIQELLAGKRTTLELEKRYIHKSGRVVHVLTNVVVARDTDGKPHHYITQLQDISARVQSSRRITQLAHVIDQTADLILISEVATGHYTFVNQSAIRTLGYSAEEFLALTALDLNPKLTAEAYETRVAALRSGEVFSRDGEMEIRTKDGHLIPIERRLQWMDDGSSGGIVVNVARDITKRKEAERHKREFVATVSHELRTPLTSIYGALALIKMRNYNELAPRVKSLIDMAHENSDRLGKIVNDFLDVEKVESGSMQFNLQAIALEPFLAKTAELNRTFAESCNASIVVKQPVPTLEVRADPDRLLQVMANLLSNASKFSPASGVVELRAAPSATGVRFEVADQGPGIPPEFRERVFQKFAQANLSNTRSHGSTGLGLAICKSMIEQMDGSIGFDSELGVGTTFYFELPLWSEVAPAASPTLLQ